MITFFVTDLTTTYVYFDGVLYMYLCSNGNE